MSIFETFKNWNISRKRKKIKNKEWRRFCFELEKLWPQYPNPSLTKGQILKGLSILEENGIFYCGAMGGGLVHFDILEDVSFGQYPNPSPLPHLYFDVTDWPNKISSHFWMAGESLTRTTESMDPWYLEMDKEIDLTQFEKEIKTIACMFLQLRGK